MNNEMVAVECTSVSPVEAISAIDAAEVDVVATNAIAPELADVSFIGSGKR